MTTVSEPLTTITERAADHGDSTGGLIPYRLYWVSWSALLAVTALMLYTESLALAPGAALAVLLGAMLVKACVIATWFMHLRFERPALVVSIVGATALTALALFVLIAPDGIASLRQAVS